MVFQGRPNHISWKLTNGGKNRLVRDVAQNYLNLINNELNTWDRASGVEEMVDILERNGRLPTLFVAEGARYPQSPESSFFDGCHRALAIKAFHLKHPNNSYLQEILAAQKDPLFKRILKKVF